MMNIPELKVFPLNNTDVITASSGGGPVGSPMGYFLGSFFDGKQNPTEYFYEATGDSNGGTIKLLLADDFGTQEKIGPLATALGLKSTQITALRYAKFKIDGNILLNKGGTTSFYLETATGTLENESEGYYYDDMEAKPLIHNLSEFFNTHLWKLEPEQDNLFFTTTMDDTYAFNTSDGSDGTFTKNP